MKIRAGDSKRLKEKGEKPIVNSSLDIQKTVIKDYNHQVKTGID